MSIRSQGDRRFIPQQLDGKRAVASRPISRFVMAALALTSFAEFASAQIPPGDAKPLCSFGSNEFSGWFSTGTVTAKGAVKPADSLNFTDAAEGDCSYYKWAARMFLWLTSRASDSGMTVDSSEFYSISALVDGKRTLTPNGGKLEIFGLRTAKPVDHSGQPGHRSVLMARNGSLVYYSSQVNEVYAHFLTGIKRNRLPQGGPDLPLPTQQAELDAIARAAGVTFRNPNTLVLEVKSAWIETTGLDKSKYITMNAMVPNFDKSLGWRWTPAGEMRQAELALVGMHVVGSVQRRPEMTWATFEHVDNAPMAGYTYLNAINNTVRVDPAPGRTWQFSASNCVGEFNRERMHARNPPHIEAVDHAKGIGPSDTCRVHAWGSQPESSTYNDSNTRIIAVNNDVFGKLTNGDQRKNYMLIGATWNFGLGTNGLANSTLETYDQRSANDRGKTCFSCHKGSLKAGELSHMWSSLQPLP